MVPIIERTRPGGAAAPVCGRSCNSSGLRSRYCAGGGVNR